MLVKGSAIIVKFDLGKWFCGISKEALLPAWYAAIFFNDNQYILSIDFHSLRESYYDFAIQLLIIDWLH